MIADAMQARMMQRRRSLSADLITTSVSKKPRRSSSRIAVAGLITVAVNVPRDSSGERGTDSVIIAYHSVHTGLQLALHAFPGRRLERTRGRVQTIVPE